MTVPAGGGRSVDIAAGADPVKLTDYAGGPDDPVYVINTGNVRVWLGDDSAVDATTGVPAEAGTCVPWSAPGTLYAAPDPAATETTTLVLTGAVADWSPSPAALAAQVATELLANGVPTVALSEEHTDDLSAATVAYPVGKYQSATLLIGDKVGSPAAQGVMVQQISGEPGNQSVIWEETLYETTSEATYFEFELVGDYIKLQAVVGDPTTTLILSTRTPRAQLDRRHDSANGDEWTIGSTAMAAGTTYPLARTNLLGPAQGLCMAEFACSLSTAQGRFILATTAPMGNITLCDTSEMVATSGSGAFLRVTKLIALPAGPYTVSFRASAAQTTNAQARFINAGI